MHLDSGDAVEPGDVRLDVGDLSLPGRAMPRGGLDSPDLPAVEVVGGAGWARPLPAPGGLYTSPSSVRLTTVLTALAGLAGETYDAPAEVLLGPVYTWRTGTQGRTVLADLVARGAIPLWRVDVETGRTRFDPWPSIGAADAHGVLTDPRHLLSGRRTVRLDGAIAAWLPGATIEGETIRHVDFMERDGEMRAEVWT